MGLSDREHDNAVCNFQRDHGLTVDGVIGLRHDLNKFRIIQI